ncbi:MAG TPA: hypothetical protein VKP69_21180 [Isosphaeraceae bacterium]|nr:hypothetical protein [Isosphaeraceae bacterium]
MACGGVVACLVLGGLALLVRPDQAPWAVGLGLATAFGPVARARRAARGTALGSAVAWAGVAVGLGLVAQVSALAEPLATGRPGAGHWAYLSALATLAALLSVLNARRPGGGAWALLMLLLVLVFLIPWLEGPGLARRAQGLARLRLDPPWTLFFGLLVAAGVTNYLPTRYGPAAAWLALGLGLEYLGLTRGDWPPARRGVAWSAVPWTLAVAVRVAGARSRRGAEARPGLEAAWLWFRDHWGVVWALRVQERFNRSAEAQGWPVRLGWYGAVPSPGVEASDDALAMAEATLKGLLRRFAEPSRVDEAVADSARRPCQPPGGGG